MSLFYRSTQYLKYRFTAKTKHGIHSPFMYEFVTGILKDTPTPQEILRVEQLRNELYRNNTVLETSDFGAGSGKKMYTIRMLKIRNIARNAGVKPKIGRLLFRLVSHFKPQTIIELGTSLGFSAMYMALANKQSSVITIEGCASTAEKAQQNFRNLKLQNIIMHQGSFSNILPHLITKLTAIDFAFFDGDHRRDATLDYFKLLLPLAHDDTIFVFDDIHWSKGMTEAWNSIKSHPRVTVSVDLFQLGIIFFKKELSKQNFIAKY